MNEIQVSVITSLYHCEKYLERYFESLKKIEGQGSLEFIFIHNSPAGSEKEIILENIKNLKICSQYIEVEREGLYKSWNRAINLANGKYLAVWNVDDFRYPDSFKSQAEILEKHPDVAMVYGDKHITRSMSADQLEIEKTRELYGQKSFLKFQDGAFLMWRKSIHNEIGYFDEQFGNAGDQDFWYRVASTYNIKKSDTILGIFSNIPFEGISKIDKKGGFERAMIAKRHGFWSPINLIVFLTLKDEYNFAYWGGQKNRLRIKKKKLTFFFLYNIIKSIVYTILFCLLGKHFYKLRSYL